MALGSWLLLLALCSLPFATARAQSASATLSGTVVDQDGAVVPGADITIINNGTGLQRQAKTNDEGSFTVPLLPPSTYTVRAQRTGFSPIEIPNVVLNVGDQKALQIQLKAGSITETVKITSDASLIDESPAVGTVVDRQFVENLPLNGRSFQSLIALTPGVVFTKADSNEQGQFSVNGQRASSNYFTVDGVSANIGTGATSSFTQSEAGAQPGLSALGGTNSLVSVDALQEFRVLTSTFSPEFGRTPGAQIQIVTRGGTNEFRGTLFEYFRNDVFDANDWFANASRQPKPPTRQNDFGGVIGGPLILPRFGEGGPAIYSGKNRTFFFFSYEGLRLRQPQSGNTTVPSMFARQQAALLAPQIAPFLNAFPIPNGADLANNFSEFNATFSNPSTLDSTSIRIDHTVNSKLTVFGRYGHAPSETVQRGIDSLNTLHTTRLKTQTLTGGATLTMTPAISNDLRLNYSRNSGATIDQLDTFGGAVPPPDSVLFPSFASTRDSLVVIVLSGGTKSSFAVGRQGETVQRQINLVDTLSVVTGAHQLKFGVDYRKLFPIFNPFQYTQQVFFGGGVNQALTGRATFAFISAFAGTRFPLLTNVSLFGQDTWKISPRLTLTYGLRWELNPPPREKNGKDGLAINGIDPTTLSFVLPQGTPIYKTTYDNFAPRVGVAYQLSQKQGRETVLRGGFGIFYDIGRGLAGFGFAFPNSVSNFLFPAGGVPFPLDPATAAPPPFPILTPPVNVGGTVVQVTDPNLELPYTHQWNFSAEQSLGPNQSVSASYVGAAGRRLYYREVLRNSNASFPGSVIVTRNLPTSDYNGLQLQFQRRLSRGLQALASYTWSKSLDTVFSFDSGNFPDARRINLDQERGPSDFDVRHAFNAAVTYDIPAPFRKGFASVLLRNFSIDTTFTARSATPVNVVTGTAAVGGSSGAGSSSRPNLIPGIPLYIYAPTFAGGRRINNTVHTAAQVSAAGCAPITPTNAKGPFCTPSTNVQGTLGRNALRGFPVFQVDLALRRQFNLTERLKLQLRAEAFNIFNHPNFGDPGANGNSTNVLTSAQFGQSINMLGTSLSRGAGGFNPLYQIGGPRSMQFALRLQF